MPEDTLDTIEQPVDGVSTPQDDFMLNPVSNFQGLRDIDGKEEQDTANQISNDNITMSDRFDASIRRENFVGSYLSSRDLKEELRLATKYPQEGYNPFDGDIDGYEDYVENFVGATTPSATKAIKRQIDREIEDRRIISTGALGGVGYDVLATVLDPVQWGLAITTGGLGNFAKGVSVAKRAAQVGLISGGETIVTEIGLQNTQTTRSYLESAFNVSGATLLGGIASAGIFKGLDAFDARNGLGDIAPDSLSQASRDTINTDVSHSGQEAGNITTVTTEMNRQASAELEADIALNASKPSPASLLGLDESNYKYNESTGKYDVLYMSSEDDLIEVAKNGFSRELPSLKGDEAIQGEAKSGGAASTNTFTNVEGKDLDIAGNTKLQRAAKKGVNSKVSSTLYKHSPILRTITSENINTRNVVAGLGENALIMQNNYTGDLIGSLDYAITKSNLDNIGVVKGKAELKAEQAKLDAEYNTKIAQVELETTNNFVPDGNVTLEDAIRVAIKDVKKVNAFPQTTLKLGDAVKVEAKRLIDNNVSPRAAATEAISNVLAKEGGSLGERAKSLKDGFNIAFEGKYVGTQASQQAAETIASKEQVVYVNKLTRLEDEAFGKWNEIQGHGKFSNKKVEFNNKAFGIYNLTPENTTRILEANNILEGSAEFKLLVKYTSDVKKEIMVPLQKDIEENLPTLWSQITTGGVLNADGTRTGGELIDSAYLHRKYNVENVTNNHEVFKNILIKYMKDGEESFVKDAQDNMSIYAGYLDNAKLDVAKAEQDITAVSRQIDELEETFENGVNELSKDELQAIRNSIGGKEQELVTLEELVDSRYITLSRQEDALSRTQLKATKMTDEQLSVAAEYTIQKITSKGGIVNPSDMVGGAGTDNIFKARTIKLPNEAFLASNPDAMGVNFINTNLNYSISRAVEGVTTETSIAKAFESKGTFKFWRETTELEKFNGVKDKFVRDPNERKIENIDDIKNYIRSGYIEKIANGDDLGTIGKQTDQDLKDIDVMYERHRGNRGGYDNPASWMAKSSKTLLSAASMAYLGKVVISSAPDVGRLVIRNGVQPSFEAFTNIIGKKMRGEMALMKRDELEAFGVGANAAMNKRAQMFSDTKGMYDETQKYDRLLEAGTNKFFQLTGINHWNDMLQTVAATSSISNAIKLGENLTKGITVKESHLAQARALGLSDGDMKDIYQQWVKAGSKKEKSVYLANINEWDDVTLSNKFTNAVHADTRQTVIEAGIGDKPSWYDANPFTRHITQFQTFISASVTRSMLSGMQTDGMRAIQGVTIMLAMAHAARYVKAYIDDPSGEKADRIDEESMSTWVLEAIDRTGMLPLLSYLNRYGTPLTGISFTGSSIGRYGQMSQTRSAVAGPTLGLIEKGVDATTNILQGSVKSSGIGMLQGLGGGTDKTPSEHFRAAGEAASRISPFANFYGISYLFNQYREGG